MSTNKPNKKTQRELSTGKSTKPFGRANDIRRDDDNIKKVVVGLYDIDNTIKYYFDNTIKPYVMEDGVLVKVPVVMGSPEKWKNIESDGYMRDVDGKILTPLISYKRTAIARNRTLTSKIDANFPQIYYSQEVRHSNKNKYDQFSVLTNRKPVKEYVNVVIPDYIDLTYDVVIWTNYVAQMNKIVESIIYTEGTYWGDLERFKFRTKIDSYTNTTDLLQESDRIVRTTFQLTMFGYLISETIAKEKAEKLSEKTYSIKQIDTDIAPAIGSDSIISPQYIANQIAAADTVVFYGHQISSNPGQFYINVNGQSIPQSAILSISNLGPNVVVVFDLSQLGFTLASNDTVSISGNFLN